MFALIFRFPTGRYHATPWGRHVNEGDVAWPPEPYRILRTLIATWYRKADRTAYDKAALARLVEALAETDPIFHLPKAIHAHTRHYMPQGKLVGGREDTKLVLDAFYRVDPGAELIAAWPQVELAPDLLALAGHLAERIGYFGRAESLATVRASDQEILSEPADKILPGETVPGRTMIDVLAPLSASAYATIRTDLLGLNSDRAGSTRRRAFEATMPPSLLEALEAETSQIQAVGWSRPPAGRVVQYARPEVGPRPARGRWRRRSIERDDKLPTVARLLLAGRPRPRIEDAVKIGEIFRQALIYRISRSEGLVPSVITGRGEDGKPLRDPGHGHAFFLPEDDDGDGFIDHLVLFVRDGLERSIRRGVEDLRRLWISDRRSSRAADDSLEDDGRQEWRLAVEGYGNPEIFRDSNVLRSSATWLSVTPYLRPWHVKLSPPEVETERMAGEECRRRGLPIIKAEFDPDQESLGRSVAIRGGRRNVLHFHRFRSRRGLVQPDRSGAALRLTFAKPIPGPIALGFGCHYGLGLFRAVD
ncbi:MAG: type I-U CRISPR-associated protein Cas5/Cas6 [Methylobacteriaceae bacterium]|nr:type I-U CRISPR-associated protein Cas5/Cas6 [Methylobacteriaceae bacterium]